MDVTADHQTLTIAWPAGAESRFHALWLRDNCPCAECRHESGQRLLDTRLLPDDLRVVGVSSNGTLHVSFSDGHVGVYDEAWLQAHARPQAPRTQRLWGAELQSDLSAAHCEDVAAGGSALRDWLG